MVIDGPLNSDDYTIERLIEEAKIIAWKETQHNKTLTEGMPLLKAISRRLSSMSILLSGLYLHQ